MNIKLNRRSIVYYIIFILVTLILLIQFGNFRISRVAQKYNVKAQKGVLDLSGWDIDAHPLLSLDGEWEFFHEQFLAPDYDGAPVHGYIKVPDLWNSFQHGGKSIGSKSYGTYRLNVLLPENQQKTLALKVPDMSSSYRLFVNGEEISSNGSPGKSLKEEIPHWKPLVRTIVSKSGQMNITVHVSNFHHMKGGMWESILLGSEEAVFRNREVNLMVSFLLVGILLISSLYYLIIFSVMQNNAASLYLALFCLMAALREFLIREVIAALVFPDIPFTLFSKLEYITVPSGPALLALSLYGLYPSVFPHKALKIVIAPFLAYMAVIIFTPLTFFGHLMNTCLVLFIIAFVYLFTIIIAAAKQNKPGARLLLFGTFIMLLTAAIDMGYASRLHSDYKMAYTFSIGFIIFVLCQMHSLSLIIADMFEKAQKLSRAELAFLQAQIVPHFLYNTLNTIIYLTRESPEKARNLLLKFSNYLRGKFDFKLYNQNLFVTFEHELEIIKSYLSIETVRFNGRLEVIYNIDEQALNCNIMPFILQPLVENALFHGIAPKSSHGSIKVEFIKQSDRIKVKVIDDGVGIKKNEIPHVIGRQKTRNKSSFNNIGLSNVDERLKLYFGDGYRLKIFSSPGIGTCVEFYIPFME